MTSIDYRAFLPDALTTTGELQSNIPNLAKNSALRRLG